jgi:hypothetical protein
LRRYDPQRNIASHIRAATHLHDAEARHVTDAALAADKLAEELQAAALASISSKRAARWASLARHALPLSRAFQKLAQEATEVQP